MDNEINTDKIISELQQKEKRLEEASRAAREIIRECSLAINAIHCKEFAEARERISKVGKMLGKGAPVEPGHFVQAKQEYCEAVALYSIVVERKIPGREQVGVETVPYLTGLCDASGELRREMLEALKARDMKAAEYYFSVMDKLHQAMLPIRFTNSVLPGFRVKQDMLRRQLEQARSEMFSATLAFGKPGRK